MIKYRHNYYYANNTYNNAHNNADYDPHNNTNHNYNNYYNNSETYYSSSIRVSGTCRTIPLSG
jgi:hypothetical protein